MVKKILFSLVTTGCLFLPLEATVQAETVVVSGAEFSRNRQVSDHSLELRGVGVKTYFFMRAFAAALYMDGMDFEADPLGEIPRHLEVKYFIAIPAKRLGDFTAAHIHRSVSGSQWEELQESLGFMKEYFVDLAVGDRFALTYLPGTGTQFSHNGRVTGVIQGEGFARALFGVWLGEDPFDRRLKEQILGFHGRMVDGEQSHEQSADKEGV